MQKTILSLCVTGILFITTSYGYIGIEENSTKSINDLPVKLFGRIVKLNKNYWQIKFSLINESNTAIYFANDPIGIKGKAGYYISVSSDNDSILMVASQVYPPLLFSPPTNKTSVRLVKLEKNQVFEGNINLQFPLMETVPPKVSPFDIKKLRPEKFQSVELIFGYFVENQAVLAFLKTKPQGWFINGKELLFCNENKKQHLYEIQNLVKVSINAS